MQTHDFNPNFFIFLTEDELRQLISSHAHKKHQPHLNAFLSATRNLKMLRRLAFDADGDTWTAPQLRKREQNGRIAIVDQAGKIRGFRETLPLPARPGEPQMRLSYDWFWGEFAKFLCQKDMKNQKKIWAYYDETNFYVLIPSATKFSLDHEWINFWQKLASKEFFEQSVRIFLDNKTLFKQQAKPWGAQDIPILSESMAQELINYYTTGRNRKRHFKQQSIPKAISELEQLSKQGNYASIPLRRQTAVSYVTGGDFSSGKKQIRCAACGEIIASKEGYKRLAVFLKNADERPQSGSDKDKLSRYCKRCVATVFLCPVKLTPETLAVRFKPQGEEEPGVTWLIEQSLRKYVAQSLHVQSGSFISLHLAESVERKPLADVWGAYHYALWKIATLFAPELFAQKGFEVEVYPGEEIFTLPRWALWLVSSLARWDSVFQYRCYTQKDNRVAFAHFLRFVSQKRIFEAFYTLISGKTNVIDVSYAKTWRLNALQDIWSEFEQILKQKEDDIMPIPDYPRIAGMVGLLLPFAEQIKFSSKIKKEDKRTAIKKLLEEVDKPVQYAYTAARETGSPNFIFCKRPESYYFYEKAKSLLEDAGEDVERLQQEAVKKANELTQKDEKFVWMQQIDEKIFLCPDQIMRVVSFLVSEGGKEGKNPPYKNEADWRAFAYQVKLALWSMFPQYLGPKESKEQQE